MVESLRKPLFLIAVLLIAVAVIVELAGAEIIGVKDPKIASNLGAAPPGYGIPCMALLDALVLFTVLLMGMALIIPDQLQGRMQGIMTLIVSFIVLLGALVMIPAAIMNLTLMLALLLSPLFGTIAYFAIFADFDTGASHTALALLMLLKLGFAGFLVFAHQRFMENKGLVLIILTSIVANLIVSFLHAFPTFLVSITDDIAGIIVAILALIWAVFLLFGSIVSIVKAVH
jgi:hypothetical protein